MEITEITGISISYNWYYTYNQCYSMTGWWFQPLWKIWKSVGIIIPNIWKVVKFMFQSPPTSTDNQCYSMTGWWFQPLWKIWKSVGIIIPNIWKVVKFMFQSPPTSTDNQCYSMSYFAVSMTYNCHGSPVDVPQSARSMCIQDFCLAGDAWPNHGKYPLVNIQKAIENGHL